MASGRHWYPQAVAVEVLAFLSILVIVPPTILHWKNRNFPATCLNFWFILLNSFNIVNAFIWPNDDMDSWWSGVGLCDVEIKFMMGAYVGVPGALMCIFRSLAVVLDTSRASMVPSRSQRWRGRLIDIVFCVAIPLVLMVIHIVIQKNRYYIFGISGCVNDFDESWMSVFLAFIWPPVILLLSGYYCCLVLYRLYKYKSQFSAVLASSNSKLSKSRFLRIFFLAFILLLGIFPLSIWLLYVDISAAIPDWHPYSWRVTHGPTWDIPIKVPSNGQVFFDRWNPIGASILTFVFIGFGRDAARVYKSWLVSLGFAHFFPSLVEQTSRPTTIRASSSNTFVGSISKGARMLFGKKQPPTSKSGSRDSATLTTFVHPPKNAFDKDLPHPYGNPTTTGTTGTRGPHRFFRALLSGLLNTDGGDDRSLLPRHHRRAHGDADPSSTTTIRTNAWAETSHVRSVDDEHHDHDDDDDGRVGSPGSEREGGGGGGGGDGGFIRVKQVISQQSEVHV